MTARANNGWAKALAGGRRQQVFLMTKVCTHGRDAKVAMRQLEDSLRRLKTDHIDLWQVHEVAYAGDPERHFMKGGVIEALDKAKQKGLVRHTGFTGHKDPSLHLKMLSFGYPFDTCQMPLNCFDATFRSFEEQSAAGVSSSAPRHRSHRDEELGRRRRGREEARRDGKGRNPLRDEPSCRRDGHGNRLTQGASAEHQYRASFRADGSRRDLERMRAAHFVCGRRSLRAVYKTTSKHEADVGKRKQHGFPLQAEMAG